LCAAEATEQKSCRGRQKKVTKERRVEKKHMRRALRLDYPDERTT
jgi:hypothetical protein